MVADSSSVLIPGPWEHRRLSANGQQFHVALAGRDGDPLIVLLHDFPEFWWAWRHQIPALAAAGCRVAAPDMRGYGASDKTPRDLATPLFCFDTAGLISALGYRDAIVVGHGLGGQVAWAMAAFTPEVVRALVAVASPSPRVVKRRPLPPRALAWLTSLFTPYFAERAITHGTGVPEVFNQWAALPLAESTQASAEVVRTYQEAMRLPFAARCAIEHFRWQMGVHNEGRWYRKHLKDAELVPTRILYGQRDTFFPPRFFSDDLRAVPIAHAGHFLPEEAPEAVTAEILAFARGLVN